MSKIKIKNFILTKLEIGHRLASSVKLFNNNVSRTETLHDNI